MRIGGKVLDKYTGREEGTNSKPLMSLISLLSLVAGITYAINKTILNLII